jgi:hypothetical protein
VTGVAFESGMAGGTGLISDSGAATIAVSSGITVTSGGLSRGIVEQPAIASNTSADRQ